ncbi:hypothetical protein [Geobacter sp.]|uniref:hypothetical protein n=1 Tax=Geobacter sp. TaxID=46610 RepID=UPI002628A36E|nr:hypothetical protein [Geobacter sp.]
MKTATKTLALILAATTSALAASGAETEGNGFLVTLFLAFGALIIAFQLVPGVLLFASMIKGLFSRPSAEESETNRSA